MSLADLYIRLWCDVTPGTGYNDAARGYLKALATVGLDIARVRVASSTREPLDLTHLPADWLLRYLGGSRSKEPRVNIVFVHPRWLGELWVEGMVNIAILVWETDRIPTGTFRDYHGVEWSVPSILNAKYREVWVPLKHTKKILEEAGVTIPVVVAPHALFEKPELIDRPRSPRLYFIGSWNARKDPGQLLEAWFQTGLTLTDDCELQLHCVPPTREAGPVVVHAEKVQREFRSYLKRVTSPVPKILGPGTAWLNHGKIWEMHQQGTTFVTATHGEGFCLPAMIAAAHGNWVIGGGPWAEELAEVAGTIENGGAVDLLPTTSIPIAACPEVWGYEIGHRWWQVDTEALREAMRTAAEFVAPPDRDIAEAVRKKYSPRAVGEILRERLERV